MSRVNCEWERAHVYIVDRDEEVVVWNVKDGVADHIDNEWADQLLELTPSLKRLVCNFLCCYNSEYAM